MRSAPAIDTSSATVTEFAATSPSGLIEARVTPAESAIVSEFVAAEPSAVAMYCVPSSATVYVEKPVLSMRA